MKSFLRLFGVILFTAIIFTLFPRPISALGTGIKGGINIGPYYDDFGEAASAIGPDGYVYVLGCPGNVPAIQKEYLAHPDVKLIIRAYVKGPLSAANGKELGEAWVKALNALQTPNNVKVWFVPLNEINNPQEKLMDSGPGIKAYLDAIAKVDTGKINLLSPSVDPFQLSDNPEQAGQIKGFINRSEYIGVALSMYAQVSTKDPMKDGDYTTVLSKLGANGKDVYIVEAGAVIPKPLGAYVAYDNPGLIETTFERMKKDRNWNGNQVKAVISFAYNPDITPNPPPWIFNATNVINSLKGFVNGPTLQTGTAGTGQYGDLPGCEFGRDGVVIETSCSEDGYNDVVTLNTSTAIKEVLFSKLLNINVTALKPEGQHEVAIEEKDFYDQVIRSTLANFFDYRKPQDVNYDDPAPNNGANDGVVAVLKRNINNVSITDRSSITVGGGDFESKTLPSGERLNNNKNCNDCRTIDDVSKILGSMFSNNKTDQTGDKEINLTKPNEILAPGVVTSQGSPKTNAGKATATPNGSNVYLSDGNPVTSLAINLLGEAFDRLSDVFARLTGQAKEDFLQDTLGIQAQLYSCTKIGNDRDLKENSRVFTNGILPDDVIENRVNKVIPNGMKTNSFSDPINQQNIQINQSYSGTNKVLTEFNFTECSSLPANGPGYNNKCGSMLTPLPNTSKLCSINSDAVGEITPLGFKMAVSDKLIALAIQASQYTCVPPEFLLGVLLKETNGKNRTGPGALVYGQNDNPIKGDPNEKVCRREGCLSGENTVSGAYSWFPEAFKLQLFNDGNLTKIGQDSNACVTALTGQGWSQSSADSRILAQAMCATAAKFYGSFQSGNPTRAACTQGSVVPLGSLTYNEKRLAIRHFCGGGREYDAICQDYFENSYTPVIESKELADMIARVKGQMGQCALPTN